MCVCKLNNVEDYDQQYHDWQYFGYYNTIIGASLSEPTLIIAKRKSLYLCMYVAIHLQVFTAHAHT